MNTHTETKHTPGPWSWFIRNGDRGRIKGKPTHYSLHNDSRNIIIAPDYSEFNGEGVWEAWVRVSESDARLIAAAPELLEGLRKLLRHSDKLGGGCSVSDDLGYARAAITKATEGAQ